MCARRWRQLLLLLLLLLRLRIGGGLLFAVAYDAPHVVDELLGKLECRKLVGGAQTLAHREQIATLAAELPNAERKFVVVDAEILVEDTIDALDNRFVGRIIGLKTNCFFSKHLLLDDFRRTSFCTIASPFARKRIVAAPELS